MMRSGAIRAQSANFVVLRLSAWSVNENEQALERHEWLLERGLVLAEQPPVQVSADSLVLCRIVDRDKFLLYCEPAGPG